MTILLHAKERSLTGKNEKENERIWYLYLVCFCHTLFVDADPFFFPYL